MPNRTMTAWLVSLVFLVSTAASLSAREAEPSTNATRDLREAFETEYRAFLASPLYLPDTSGGYSSRLEYSAEASAFRQRLLVMGPAVTPFLMDKLDELNKTAAQSDRATFMRLAICRVARRWFAPEEWPGGRIGGTRPSDGTNILLSWWQAGQKGTTERFEKLFSEWKRLKIRNSLLCRHDYLYEDHSKAVTLAKDYASVTDLGRTFEAISGLGLGALPPMMDKLRAGDYDVLPFIAEIRRDEAATLLGIEPSAERARRCLEWWDKNKEQWTIPFPDVVQPPAAAAAVPAQPVTAEKTTAPAKPQPKAEQPPAPAG